MPPNKNTSTDDYIGTVNVEAGKKKIREMIKEKVKKIFQGHEQNEKKRNNM